MFARVRLLLFTAICVSVWPTGALAQPLSDVSILVVTAHPDDDALFAGSVYRIARELGGKVDLAVVTDGAGGYRYSTLAESIYGLKLTDPEIAAQYLPAIRKQELLAGGRIVGFRRYHFMDQPDTGKLTDPDSVLSLIWDADAVLNRLVEIMSTSRYDFVFTFLPLPEQHGHHKAAAILSLRAAAQVAESHRPVVLGAWLSGIGEDGPIRFDGLDGYSESRTVGSTSSFRFDRSQSIEDNERLTYKIPVNWLISEHKSQGTMQLFVNHGDAEEYWVYALNPPDAVSRAASLFRILNGTGSESPPSDSD